ncbi:MAG TPA: hypothetical protein VGM94_01585 [Galbitalea sp.]
MIAHAIQLRCGAVSADMHVYLGAVELEMLTTDLTPSGIVAKRRLVQVPGHKRPLCEVVSLEDGHSGTEVSFRLLVRGEHRASAVASLAAAIEARARRAGHIARPIGFRRD